MDIEPALYSILPRRKAYSYFREDKIDEAIRLGMAIPSHEVLKVDYNALSTDSREQYQLKENDDNQRFVVERHLFNFANIRPAFGQGDKVAACIQDRLVRARIISGSGKAFTVEDLAKTVHFGISPDDLYLEKSTDVPGTWLKGLSVKDKVYALKSIDAHEYRHGTITQVLENARCLIRFSKKSVRFTFIRLF